MLRARRRASRAGRGTRLPAGLFAWPRARVTDPAERTQLREFTGGPEPGIGLSDPEDRAAARRAILEKDETRFTAVGNMTQGDGSLMFGIDAAAAGYARVQVWAEYNTRGELVQIADRGGYPVTGDARAKAIRAVQDYCGDNPAEIIRKPNAGAVSGEAI